MQWVMLCLLVAMVIAVAATAAHAVRLLHDRRPPAAPKKTRASATVVRPARSTHPARPAPAGDVPAQWDPADIAELAERFAAVEAEQARAHSFAIGMRLRVLAHRRVPLRAVQPAPAHGTARICFADGTVVIARAARPGELLNLVCGVHRAATCLAAWDTGPHVTTMRFAWNHGHTADLIAIGLDNSD